MGPAASIALVLLVMVVLVAIGYVLGRGIWSLAQPGDQDPGGKESPPPALDPKIWTGTPFVDYLRLYRRLRRQHGKGRRPKRGV